MTLCHHCPDLLSVLEKTFDLRWRETRLGHQHTESEITDGARSEALGEKFLSQALL